jgi:hypothetical protein
MQTLTTPLQFFNDVVVKDVEAFEKEPHSVRLLLHAVTSIHHLREWVFKAQHGDESELDAKERKKLWGAFNEELYKCDALKEIRELASNAKHFPPDLDAKGKPLAQQRTFDYTAPAANSPLHQIGWPEVTAKGEDGTDIGALRTIVREGFEFWQRKVENGEWGLQ